MLEYIQGPFKKEHDLDDSEKDKPLSDVEDFDQVLRYH